MGSHTGRDRARRWTLSGDGAGCARRPDERLQFNRRRDPTMRLTAIAHHLMPFAALAGGILVLLMPRLLNYVVAIYLILVGFIGLNSLFHFFR
jgi:hypothetical protein